MSLNCKRGDVAIILGGVEDNLGKIVTCLEFVPAGTYYEYQGHMAFREKDSWMIDCDIHQFSSQDGMPVRASPYCSDMYMKPLKDEEGDDETLAWAGKPALKEKEEGITC